MPLVGKTIEHVSLCGGVTTMIFTDGSQAVITGPTIDLIGPIEDQPVGTFECPICKQDTPHKHSGTEIARYRAAQQKKFLDTSNGD